MAERSEYRRWWDGFRSRIDQQERHMDFFSKKKEELGLSEVRSVISIGAGCGEVDTYVIKECMPKLRTYIGVEPNEDNRNSLAENLRTCPEVDVTLFNEKIPGWSGPEERVDLILAIHVSWYFSKPAEVYKQLMNWLKPGGKLLIGHACDDYLFARIGSFLACVEQGANTDTDSNEYWYRELQKDLASVGLDEYDEYMVPCRLDIRNVDMTMLEMCAINFDTMHISEEQKVESLRRAAELCKGKGDYATWNNVFLCIKN